jgi:hypothetical protein
LSYLERRRGATILNHDDGYFADPVYTTADDIVLH